MRPFKYQQEVIDSIGEDNALIAAALGTGKTPMATWLAGDAKHVLIVGPIRTFDGWQRTVKEIAGVELHNATKANKQGKQVLEDLWAGKVGWYFIGWELMRTLNVEKRFDGRKKKLVNKSKTKVFNDVKFDLVIADEWHRAANKLSQNFEVISRVNSKRRLALSATPAGDNPVNIYAAYKWLWPDTYSNFRKFATYYFECDYNPYAKPVLGAPPSLIYGREKKPGRLKSIVPHHVTVSAETAYPDMQQPNIQRINCTMTRSQTQQYRQLSKKAIAWLQERPLAVDMPMHLDMRLRQLTLGDLTIIDDEEGKEQVVYDADCKSGKLDAFMDIVKDLGDEKQIVYTHSKRFLVPLKRRLEKANLSYVEVSGDDRDSWRQFRDDPNVQFLVAVIPAVAEGVDGLQHVCHVEHWLSQDNRVVLNQQATGRLHRGGQCRRVTRYLYQCPGTVDTEALEKRLTEKYESLKESGLV